MFHPSTTNQDSRSLPSTEYSSVPRIQDNHAGRTYEFHFVAKEWPSEFSPWCQPWSLPWPEHILASQTEQLYPVETSDWDLELYEDETFSSEDAPSAQDGLVADQSEKPIAAIRCYYPECNKTFKREWNLKAHKRTHDSETLREHKCKECGRAFARGHDLVRHGITHDGRRQYPCKQCGRCFSRVDTARRHLKNDCARMQRRRERERRRARCDVK